MLYGNYGLGSFPESQLPLFLIICYSSLFQSKMRSDLWEIAYKMKHGNMGWMMINGSYDMCLQKCKRAQACRRGSWRGVTLQGFPMSKGIKAMHFLVVMLLAHEASSEEKAGQHGGKHFLTPALKNPSWESLLDLWEGSSFIYVLQCFALFCTYDGYFIAPLFPC